MIMKKKKNTIIGYIFITLAIFGPLFAACGNNDSENSIPVNSITLNMANLPLTVGNTETLTPTIMPTNATNQKITWSTSTPAIATVNNGSVTAISTGTATITVTTADGNKTATCSVTVIPATLPIPVTDITLDNSILTLTVGNTGILTPTIIPPNATNPAVIWTSNNTSIATVTNGTVTAVSTGTTTITVTTKNNNKTAICTVTVQAATSSIVSTSGIEMVLIPAGTFIMGSPSTEPDRNSDETQHSVTLTKSFYMGKYAVTQEQYHAVTGIYPSYSTILNEMGIIFWKFPVDEVTWYDTIVFCNKLSMIEGLNPVYSINNSTNPADWGTIPTSNNTTWDSVIMDMSKNGYRLPTEAEWEYACRAGTTTPYNTGKTIKSNQANFNSENASIFKTVSVRKYSPNNWGLHNMHGNVFEWCSDNVEEGVNSVRSSSWLSNRATVRSAFRLFIQRDMSYIFMGFRVARSAF